MKVLFVIVICIYAIVSSISIMVGLNLKKWYSWLVGAFGFIAGFLIGLLSVDAQTGIAVGIIFSFLTLTSAAVSYRNRKNSLNFLEILDNEKYPRLTRYANFLKRFFHL